MGRTWDTGIERPTVTLRTATKARPVVSSHNPLIPLASSCTGSSVCVCEGGGVRLRTRRRSHFVIVPLQPRHALHDVPVDESMVPSSSPSRPTPGPLQIHGFRPLRVDHAASAWSAPTKVDPSLCGPFSERWGVELAVLSPPRRPSTRVLCTSQSFAPTPTLRRPSQARRHSPRHSASQAPFLPSSRHPRPPQCTHSLGCH